MKPENPEIPDALHDAMEAIAGAVTEYLESVLGEEHAGKLGITLIVAEFGEHGWVSYLSNVDRADMVTTLRSFIEQNAQDEVEIHGVRH